LQAPPATDCLGDDCRKHLRVRKYTATLVVVHDGNSVVTMRLIGTVGSEQMSVSMRGNFCTLECFQTLQIEQSTNVPTVLWGDPERRGVDSIYVP
jgi:hypothetical protein